MTPERTSRPLRARTHAERMASRAGSFTPESVIWRVGNSPLVPLLDGARRCCGRRRALRRRRYVSGRHQHHRIPRPTARGALSCPKNPRSATTGLAASAGAELSDQCDHSCADQRSPAGSPRPPSSCEPRAVSGHRSPLPHTETGARTNARRARLACPAASNREPRLGWARWRSSRSGRTRGLMARDRLGRSEVGPPAGRGGGPPPPPRLRYCVGAIRRTTPSVPKGMPLGVNRITRLTSS
jgi:hypothetical protein